MSWADRERRLNDSHHEIERAQAKKHSGVPWIITLEKVFEHAQYTARNGPQCAIRASDDAKVERMRIGALKQRNGHLDGGRFCRVRTDRCECVDVVCIEVRDRLTRTRLHVDERAGDLGPVQLFQDLTLTAG